MLAAPTRPPVRTRKDLEHYQLGMAGFVGHHNNMRSQIWGEMGCGKSAAVLTAFVDALETFDAAKMLVVAPKRVAESTWEDEIMDWAHCNHLKIHFLTGGADSMRKQIAKYLDKADVFTVSCDNIHNLTKLYFGKRHPFDWVVLDESSKFKNSGSRRTEAATLLTIHPHRVTLLTGTPRSKGLGDLWSQTYLLDRGHRLGRTEKAFDERFFSCDANRVKKAESFAETNIKELLADITYVLRPEDFTDVKRPKYNYINIKLNAKQQADYDKFEKDYILRLLEEGEVDGFEIKAKNEMGLSRKLVQYASGAVYDENKVAHEVHTLKIDELKEIVEENPGKPILVAYNFIHERERIMAAFPNAEVFQTREQQDRWNAGEIEMLLASPKSAGHGLNLQFGGHILVWFSVDYDLETYLQTNKRLARKGQKNEVIIHHLLVKGTMDEMIMNSLRYKDTAQNEFQEALKKHIAEVLKSLRASNDYHYKGAKRA